MKKRIFEGAAALELSKISNGASSFQKCWQRNMPSMKHGIPLQEFLEFMSGGCGCFGILNFEFLNAAEFCT